MKSQPDLLILSFAGTSLLAGQEGKRFTAPEENVLKESWKAVRTVFKGMAAAR